MLAVGIVLLLIGALLLVAAAVGGSNDPAQFDLGIFTIGTNTLGVFLLGAATVLLILLGLELVRRGARRGHRRRKKERDLSKRNQQLEGQDTGRGDQDGPGATAHEPGGTGESSSPGETRGGS